MRRIAAQKPKGQDMTIDDALLYISCVRLAFAQAEIAAGRGDAKTTGAKLGQAFSMLHELGDHTEHYNHSTLRTAVSCTARPVDLNR